MNRIILASASPRRNELLQQIGLCYEQQISGVDETIHTTLTPRARVMNLAKQKAESIAVLHPDALVIGADTVVVLGNRILEKPKDDGDAAAMLMALSGQEHAVLTGLALAGPHGQQTRLHCEETLVRFRKLDPWEVQWYIHSGEHVDKAGAYGIQGKAAVFVSCIQGCYFNVVGLPLNALFTMMKDSDIPIEKYIGSITERGGKV